jgi:hypothetical protein
MCRVTFLPAGFLSRDSALDRTTSSVQNYHGILPPTRARAADRLPSTFAATACGGCAALTVPKKAVRRMGGPRRSGRRVHGWRHAKGGRARHPAHSRRVRPVEPPAHGPISKRQPFSLRSACSRWRSDMPAGVAHLKTSARPKRPGPLPGNRHRGPRSGALSLCRLGRGNPKEALTTAAGIIKRVSEHDRLSLVVTESGAGSTPNCPSRAAFPPLTSAVCWRRWSNDEPGRADERPHNAPVPGRGPVCLTAHEPSRTLRFDEKGRLKFLARPLAATKCFPSSSWSGVV